MGLLEMSKSSDESIPERVFETALLVDKYYTPFLCLFGALGNSLSLIVFCIDAKYRNQSAPYYLSALAISDTGFLLNLFAVWLEGVYGGGVITSKLMCPLVMYLGQVTCFISVYLIVAFSIERYVAVHYPFSRPRICTRSKAKKVIAVLTLVALVTFSYVWVIAQVVELDLDVPTNYTEVDMGLEEGDNLTRFHLNGFAHLYLDDQTNGIRRPRLENNTNIEENEIAPTSSAFSGSHQVSEILSSGRIKSKLSISTRDGLDSRTYGEILSPPWDSKNGERHSDLEAEHIFLRCTVPLQYYQISEIANYLDSVVTLVIPFILITFFNVRIAMCVWKLKNQRETIIVGASYKNTDSPDRSNGDDYDYVKELDDDSSTSSRGKRPQGSHYGTQIIYLNHQQQQSHLRKANGERAQKRGVRFQTGDSKGEDQEQQHNLLLPPTISPKNRLKLSIIRDNGSAPPSSEVRVTRTLLLISFMFLILNFPAHVLRCAQFIQSLTGTTQGKEIIQAALPWTNILFNTNFAVNFFLYCASGRNFRKSLLNIIVKLFRKRSNAHANSASSPPSQLNASLPVKRKRRRNFATTTIKLTTAALNGNCVAGAGTSPVGNNAIQVEATEMESETATMARDREGSVYSTYIGNEMGISV